jgi:hypothetical protein
MGSAAAQFEFSGFPKTQAGESTENEFLRYVRLSEEHHGLIPQSMLPAALGLSTQRISQLIASNRFDVHRIGGKAYVTGDSFQTFLEIERTTGTRYGNPAVGTLVKAAFGK